MNHIIKNDVKYKNCLPLPYQNDTGRKVKILNLCQKDPNINYFF